MRVSLLLAALALVGCASTHSQPRDVTFQTLPGGTGTPGAGGKVTQFELQQIVQRFTSTFAGLSAIRVSGSPTRGDSLAPSDPAYHCSQGIGTIPGSAALWRLT